MDYVTKDDLREALAPLPTREEFREVIREGIQSASVPYATREEMRAEIRDALAPYPTREEMREEIRGALAAHPTRDEMRNAIREEGERTRRHMDAVTESDRDDTRLLAEGYAALTQKVDKVRPELDAEIAALARRVTRLEVSRE